jgi:hypothetical protein
VFRLGEKKNHPGGGAAASRRSEEVEGLSALQPKSRGLRGGFRLSMISQLMEWFLIGACMES